MVVATIFYCQRRENCEFTGINREEEVDRKREQGGEGEREKMRKKREEKMCPYTHTFPRPSGAEERHLLRFIHTFH